MSNYKPGAYGRNYNYNYSSAPARPAAVQPPPPGAQKSKHGYSTMSSIASGALATYNFNAPKRKIRTEEEYFDSDGEGEEGQSSAGMAYIPAPGSPSASDRRRVGGGSASAAKDDSDSEEDTLDAFMASIDQQAGKGKGGKASAKKPPAKGVRDDIEGEDDHESFFRYMEENPNAGTHNDESDQEIEYDAEGNPIVPVKSKYIDPLPPIDHTQLKYEDFVKNFYIEPDDIGALSLLEIDQLRHKLGIKVSGPLPARPVTSFAHFGFDESLMKAIRKMEYTQPTPIQSQAVPVALGGRDVIGIAKTGSGKTAAFLWPMLVHIMDQPELRPGDGPIGLVLAPTRELSQQIYSEAKRFGKVYNIHVVCCYGGGSKWEQSKALEAGAEIVVATPGRMIDMIKMKATNLLRVTYLVMDEADKMFNMGFEPQVRSICDHVRPDRQTLLFSATFKKRVERLARDVLTDPVRIVQGDLGEANEDVTQHVVVIGAGAPKWAWLMSRLVAFTSEGSVLIFVTRKANSEELANNLRKQDFKLELIHGDIDQSERNRIITAFKQKSVPILVATDVAARGLDIPHIRTVVNYDVARDIDTHTHRIGRTGRAGQKGSAYTLITTKDKDFAGHLVRNLEGAGQDVPEQLMELAMQNAWFRKSRFKSGEGKNLNVGGRGLGYRERPGLAAPSEPTEPAAAPVGGTYGAPAAEQVHQAGPPDSNAPSGRGPASERLSAMKQAFKAQYMSTFTAAKDTSWQKTNYPGFVSTGTGGASASTDQSSIDGEQPKRRKKSRWE
ncbi:ATP-dependent RNA helicase DDX42-like isoform X1 [Amphibalanus amphitrite]|nr:ATP-dependent RNA helicase DDX42-like isoform X1 [Amphibalanus amphitrite]